MKAYVYLIERIDGMCYVGITIDPKKRFRQHSRSDRFNIGIKSTKILEECDDYSMAENLEEYYINKLDTFKNGLNLTNTGKGMSDCKFNTLGHVFSEKSRLKMSKSAKKRGVNTTGYKFDDEVKERWSELRKNKYWGNNKKITDDEALIIYNTYANDELEFDVEFMKAYVKKTQRESIEDLPFNELSSPNGRPLSKMTLYAGHYAKVYDVTSATIRQIIDNNGVRCESASS